MSGDDIPLGQKSAWERWQLASFDPPPPIVAPPPAETQAAAAPEPQIQLPTAEELEQIHQRAHDEGYAAGLAEGRQEALVEAQRLGDLCREVDQKLNTLNEPIAEELLDLALEVARQVLRQAVVRQPEAILAVIKEAITLLPHQHAAVYLSPEDAALARSHIGEQLSHLGHRVLEDPRLARGDCRVDAGNTQIDATLATRWRRVVADLGSEAPLQDGEPAASARPQEEPDAT